MKKFIDLKGFVIGSLFLLLMIGLGVWLFGLPLLEAGMIAVGCVVVLGVIAAFEKHE